MYNVPKAIEYDRLSRIDEKYIKTVYHQRTDIYAYALKGELYKKFEKIQKKTIGYRRYIPVKFNNEYCVHAYTRQKLYIKIVYRTPNIESLNTKIGNFIEREKLIWD